MTHEVFQLENGRLFCERCSLEGMARSVSTPFYVYSSRCLRERYRQVDQAFAGVSHLICYALKANSQPELLRALLEEGAGAEVVSGAELALARAVGFAPDNIVFSGVGKTEEELEAGLKANIRLCTVESEGELESLERLARHHGLSARVAIRINPAIDPKTHPHIATGVETAKFGLDPETALGLYARRDDFPHLHFTGIHSHIGSQLKDLEPLAESARLLERLYDELAASGLALTDVNWGGGLGIDDGEAPAPTFEDYAGAIVPWISRCGAHLIIEPGRAIVGPAGALVVRVLYVKRTHGRRFAVVDGGMNDLIRPALYGATHRILPLAPRGPSEPVDVVGAVCESSDVFGREQQLGELQPGDFLAILDVGAYGFSMSSNYNLRPRPAEVIVERERFRLVRQAETANELVATWLRRR